MCGVSVIRGLQREGSGFRVVGFLGLQVPGLRFRMSDSVILEFGWRFQVSACRLSGVFRHE